MGKDIITYQKRLELIDECLRKFEKPKNIKEIAKYCNDRLPHPFDERMYRYDIKKIAESYDVDILETVINGYKCYTYRDESFSIKDGHPTFQNKYTEPVNAREFAAELIKPKYQNGFVIPELPQD